MSMQSDASTQHLLLGLSSPIRVCTTNLDSASNAFALSDKPTKNACLHTNATGARLAEELPTARKARDVASYHGLGPYYSGH
jgi:hypothetical protein